MADQTIRLERPRLEIIWPDGKVQDYTIKGQVTSVGRQLGDNQIVVPNEIKSISRTHFEIRQEVFKFLVVDLDSTNGVYLNNERIDQSAELKDSDVIVIGEKDKKEEVRILFHYPMGEMLKQIEKVPREISEPISMEMTSDLPDGLPYLKFRWLTKYDLYLPLEKDKTLLGRGEKADLRFPSNLPYTSSEHAEIRRTQTGFEIVDLNSTNGTSLNGKLLLPEMPATLHHGDIIRIGDEAYGVSTGINFYNPLEIVPISQFRGQVSKSYQ